MINIQVLASGSGGNCYRITDGNTPLLLEAGIPWRLIKVGLEFRTSEIAGVLLSHNHLDHCKAAKDAIKAGLDIYCTEGTKKAVGLSGHRVKVIEPLKQFKVGTWQILPFDTVHDAEEPVGYLLASGKYRVVFITDTMYCKYRFNGLTHIMAECNYSMDILRANVEAGIVDVGLKNRIIQSHFSLANVKEFLKANVLSRVEQIILLHLSDDNSDSERFKREIQGLTGKPVSVAEML